MLSKVLGDEIAFLRYPLLRGSAGGEELSVVGDPRIAERLGAALGATKEGTDVSRYLCAPRPGRW